MVHMKKDKAVKQFNALIKRIANGEKKAFEEFYNLFSGFIYSTATRMTRSQALIEDIVDDVSVKVWNSAAKQKYIENPFGWLYTVTVNCAKDRFKANRVYTEIFEVAVIDKGLTEFENTAAFHSMLACLDGDEERIVKLHLEESYTFKEIAQAERKSLSTVSSAYYRAINKVRLFLEENSKK